MAARLALQAAQGAPRRRQVEVLLQCARCDLLGDVTDAVSHMDEGAAASPVGQAISLAAALADEPHAVTAALQASGESSSHGSSANKMISAAHDAADKDRTCDIKFLDTA